MNHLQEFWNEHLSCWVIGVISRFERDLRAWRWIGRQTYGCIVERIAQIHLHWLISRTEHGLELARRGETSSLIDF